MSGVVWDLGNVLIRWDPLPAVAAGVGETEAQRFLDGFDFGAWNHAQDAGRPWAQALSVLPEEWRAHGQAYVDHFEHSMLGPVAGTHDLVRELHTADVLQIGLTNWSAELYPAATDAYDIIGLLRDVVVSGHEGLAKPDPEIFRVAGQRAGVPLDSLVFVDDSPANVAAAADLGMHAFRFTDAQSLRAQLRDLGLPVHE